MSPQAVIDFWFETLQPEQWWQKNSTVDERIRQQFATTWQQARAGELWHWRNPADTASATQAAQAARGRLAEIIVLDQFSRNLFRDKPKAFVQDALALVLAQEAVQQKAYAELDETQTAFLLMPYMHSESAAIHAIAEPLFAAHTTDNHLEFEQKHRQIIERFGRYPHRNKILGRPSTDEEIAFLQEPGSSF